MTSVLNVDSIAAKNGTSPVTLTKQEVPKARLMFDHANTTIDGSFNISSVADNGTGQSSPSFINSMTLGYATVAVGAQTSNYQTDCSVRGGGGSHQTQLTSSYRVLYAYGTTNYDDEMLASITVGDLA